MSKKETLESEFFVLTGIHKKYATLMVAQVVHTVLLFGVDDLLTDLASRISADDANIVRKQLKADEISDALKKYELWKGDDVVIHVRQFSVSLSTKVESDFRPNKRPHF